MPARRWSVVLALKPLPLAKSRLVGLSDELRRELVVAMAVDTVVAALGCPSVRAVLVVTDDARAATESGAAGAAVVPDEPAAGLNAALAFGARRAAAIAPGDGVAALGGDLPALRPSELGLALERAAAHPRAVVADAQGTGTALLCAGAGVALLPAYGPGSFRRHVAAGAVPLDVDRLAGLRRDVDLPTDLDAAARLGVGARTARLLPQLRPDLTAESSP